MRLAAHRLARPELVIEREGIIDQWPLHQARDDRHHVGALDPQHLPHFGLRAIRVLRDDQQVAAGLAVPGQLVAVGIDLGDEEGERGAGAVAGEEGIGGARAAGERAR